MKIKVGITGGIGSGKSLISKLLIEKGYPVFNSDDEAKRLLIEDSDLIFSINKIFGSSSYTEDGDLNREYLAHQIFNFPELREKMNSIVHPAVRRSFDRWCEVQSSKIVFNEAAILFETGSYSQFDYTILIVAEESTRIKRVIARDNSTSEQVKKRMESQWSDEEKRKLASFIIENNTTVFDLHSQIDEVLEKLHKEN